MSSISDDLIGRRRDPRRQAPSAVTSASSYRRMPPEIIFSEFCIINKTLVCAFAFPLLYESWDKVYTWFICDHMTRTQHAGHKQVAKV